MKSPLLDCQTTVKFPPWLGGLFFHDWPGRMNALCVWASRRFVVRAAAEGAIFQDISWNNATHTFWAMLDRVKI